MTSSGARASISRQTAVTSATAFMDPVTLIGRDGEEQITVEELGALSGRFHYEFVCCLGKRIPRVYIR